MSARALRLALSAALLTGSGIAQFVFPAAYATTPGNAVANAPFTVPAGLPTTSTRVMVVLDAAAVPFPIGTTLSQIALRRDSAYATSYNGFQGTLRVRVGTAVAAPDAIQDVRFARLWADTPHTARDASAGPISVPAALAAPGIAPFALSIPFTAPWTWPGGPLAIEFLFTPTAGSATWRSDAFTTGRGNGSFRSLGQGCTGSNGFAPYHYPLPETLVPGAALTLRLEGAVRPTAPGTLHDVSLHLLGFAALPLPIDLGPILGTPAGCALRIDPLLQTLVPTGDASLQFQRAEVQIPLPTSAALAGVALHSQWLCFDLGAGSPFPATLSDALELTLGQLPPPPAPRRARTLWRYGANGLDSESGSMAADEYGPILRFQ